jgi:hypothetical protein
MVSSLQVYQRKICEFHICPVRVTCFSLRHVCDILLMFCKDYILCYRVPHYAVSFAILLLPHSTTYSRQCLVLSHLHSVPNV